MAGTRPISKSRATRDHFTTQLTLSKIEKEPHDEHQALKDVQIKGVCVHLPNLRLTTKAVLCFSPQSATVSQTMAGFCGVGQV
ncbi:hypothetical protein JTE90_011528 [Oedothorax gibbosus]|uniref:Uncharacterized protein n=1 Tax=Oedothorax gibbosus TaxID=931172 RepID=A0AAV6UIM4_9ARAC|nr:hypothetical protein JTE90_011528 [Oedothorax gibbosus]